MNVIRRFRWFETIYSIISLSNISSCTLWSRQFSVTNSKSRIYQYLIERPFRRINCISPPFQYPFDHVTTVVDYAFPPFFFHPSCPLFFSLYTGVQEVCRGGKEAHARFTRPLLFRHSFTRHAHAKRPANERRSLNFNEVPARRSWIVYRSQVNRISTWSSTSNTVGNN